MEFRKVFFLIVLLTITSIQIQGQIHFGIKGGINVSNFHVKADKDIDDILFYLNQTNFHMGFLTEIQINNKFSIQPELLFSAKGAIHKACVESVRINPIPGYMAPSKDISKATYSIYYIELPIYFKTMFEAGKSGDFTIGIGPYVSYGIRGRNKGDAIVDTSHPTEINWDRDLFVGGDFYNAFLKHFDVGLSGFVGYELDMGIFTTISYDMGLYNIKKNNDNIKLNNRTFSVSIGYKF